MEDRKISLSNSTAGYRPPDPALNVMPESEQAQNNYDLSSASHPFVCVFTFLFKLLSFLIYLFGGFLFSDTLIFILVIVLDSFDFWTVKNVSGRFLVGLRWWSDYNENGEEVWKFQSHNFQFKSNKVDYTFFWTSQISSTIGWLVLLFIKLISFSVFWSILTFAGFSLSFTNLYGYYKCSSDHKNKLDGLKEGAMRAGFNLFANRMR